MKKSKLTSPCTHRSTHLPGCGCWRRRRSLDRCGSGCRRCRCRRSLFLVLLRWCLGRTTCSLGSGGCRRRVLPSFLSLLLLLLLLFFSFTEEVLDEAFGLREGVGCWDQGRRRESRRLALGDLYCLWEVLEVGLGNWGTSYYLRTPGMVTTGLLWLRGG